MNLLEADLRKSDIALNLQGVDSVQWLQSMAKLQQMLIVYGNLELMLFCHDNHVEVGIRHEGEIRAVSLLRTPPSALARVPQHHVKVSPDTKSNIAM